MRRLWALLIHTSAEAGFLPVLGQSSASPEPDEDALDDRSAGQDLEALSRVGALDDLSCPLADPGERAARLPPGIAAVNEDTPEPRAGSADRGSPGSPAQLCERASAAGQMAIECGWGHAEPSRRLADRDLLIAEQRARHRQALRG